MAVAVTYSEVPTCYDVLTGIASDPQEITRSFPETVPGSALMGEDFLFVPATDQTVSISITAGNEIKTAEIPIAPNFRTNITVSF